MYALTGNFPILLAGFFDDDDEIAPFHPARMEIELISTNPAIKGAVSYVSDECLEDYGIDPYNYNAVFGEVNRIVPQKRKKRAVVQTNITPKCFNWKDVLQLFTRYLNNVTSCMSNHNFFCFLQR